jgi:hypothetical protein
VAGTITGEISSFVAAVLAGATAAFGGVTELGATALAAIAALSVASVAGDSASDEQRTYEGSPKHGKEQRGNAAPEPTHGQETLDRSVSIKPTTTRRVGYDPDTGEFDVFDETHPGSGIYHGHQRTWDQLSQDMQNALVKAGVVNRKGKPL